MLANQTGNIMMNFEKNFERRGSMAVNYTRWDHMLSSHFCDQFMIIVTSLKHM